MGQYQARQIGKGQLYMILRADGWALSKGPQGPCWHDPEDPSLSVNPCVFLEGEARVLEWAFNNL